MIGEIYWMNILLAAWPGLIVMYLLIVALTTFLLTEGEWKTRGSRIFCVLMCVFAPISLPLLLIWCLFYCPVIGIKELIKWIKAGEVKPKKTLIRRNNDISEHNDW